jgi:hypothetical protein
MDSNTKNINGNITNISNLKPANIKHRTFKSHLILDDIPTPLFDKQSTVSNKSLLEILPKESPQHSLQTNLDVNHALSSPLKKNWSDGNISSPNINKRKKATLPNAKSTNNLASKISNLNKTSYSNDALQLLADRGQKNSSLVSLGISSKIKNHWIVKICKRNVFFLGRITRSLTVPSNFLSGISRLFITVAVLLALMLSMISIASVLQHHLQIFPSLIDFYKFDNGTIHFDHKIVNVTLYPFISTNSNNKSIISEISNNVSNNEEIERICNSNNKNECLNENIINDKDNKINIKNYQNLFDPYYAICDLKWHTLSLLDLALISEVSYFDENLQNIIGDNLIILFIYILLSYYFYLCRFDVA